MQALWNRLERFFAVQGWAVALRPGVSETERLFPLTARYRLRYFFDAGSGVCLWSGNDAAQADYGIAITPEQLPLSPETRQEVERLVAWYDTSLDWNDPAGPTPWSPEEGACFKRAAQALLQQLQAQLGPAYEIGDEFKVLNEA